ncbi:MAG: hypothetical protein HYZ72_01625 [Deltaproteobacteria bacterium]|nr:hypothetical protein [Deltaproteobacteria bacterium]
MAIQSNGKIVVVGSSDALGTSDFALARYNADGSLDATFGVNGLQITNFGNLEVANAVAIQSDGKIVVAGWTNVFGTFDFALARYNADGSLDATFDGDGKKITSFGGDDRANAVAIQKSDGRIVVAGWTNVFGTFDFALARYNANGSLDVTFDGDGKKISGFGGDDRANAVAIQKSDGRIVVAGWTNVFGTADFALARYNVDGSLDATFDVNGEKITGFGGDERANAVVVQSNGKIVAAGWTDVLGTFDFALARYNADGSLDATFDGDGKKITSFGSDDRARAMAIQSNGRIVVAGWTNVFGTFDFALARFLVE